MLAYSPFIWKTDNEGLKWLQTQRELNRRQTRWVTYLQTYDFSIEHLAGKLNKTADALSRRPDYLQAALNALTTVALTANNEFLDKVEKRLDDDPWLQDRKNLEQLTWTGRFWFNQSRLYVPDGMGLREALLAEAHDVEGGHAGVAKTISTLYRRFWWPGLHRQVKNYVSSCHTCATTKPTNQRPGGLLKPPSIPTRRWQSVATDMVTDLPGMRGYDSVIVFICRLSKYAVLVPCKKTITSAQYADLFYKHVVCPYGVPDELISDRDPRFTAGFWQTFLEKLGTTLKLSTAYHPQTDGASERLNRTWQQYMRTFVGRQPRKWLEYLPVVQAAYNNSSHSMTGFTPNYLQFGREVESVLDKLVSELHGESEVPAVDAFTADLQTALQDAKRALQGATDRMKMQADKSRRDVSFAVGDRVYLSTKNLRFKGSKKLKPRFVGPFEVMQVVYGSAYKLKLPEEWLIHPVFHVSLLKPAVEREELTVSDVPEAVAAAPAPIAEAPLVELEVPREPEPSDLPPATALPQPESPVDERRVTRAMARRTAAEEITTPTLLTQETTLARIPEKILSKRITRRSTQYLVQFQGLPEHEASYLTPDQLPFELLATWHREEEQRDAAARTETLPRAFEHPDSDDDNDPVLATVAVLSKFFLGF